MASSGAERWGGAPVLAWGWVSVVLVLLISLDVVILIPVCSTVVAALAPAELRGRYMDALGARGRVRDAAQAPVAGS